MQPELSVASLVRLSLEALVGCTCRPTGSQYQPSSSHLSVYRALCGPRGPTGVPALAHSHTEEGLCFAHSSVELTPAASGNMSAKLTEKFFSA